jgi:hypothetical protein
MYLILDNLATHGIGEPRIIKGYVNCEIGFINDFRIVDVRTLLEGQDNNNPISEYLLNIVRVTSYLEIGEKVVICSYAGVSRSNTMAIGVLARYFKMDFHKAIELVRSKVPICNVLDSHITAVKKLLDGS